MNNKDMKLYTILFSIQLTLWVIIFGVFIAKVMIGGI